MIRVCGEMNFSEKKKTWSLWRGFCFISEKRWKWKRRRFTVWGIDKTNSLSLIPADMKGGGSPSGSARVNSLYFKKWRTFRLGWISCANSLTIQNLVFDHGALWSFYFSAF
jgi:hypothetical protein